MLNCRITCIVCVAAASVLPVGREARTDDSRSPTEDWLQASLAELQEYRFERVQSEPVDLTMEQESLLNWSNAERGTNQGGLFLWTHEGRPQLIACAFKMGGSLKYEFHSLSTERIAAYRRDSVIHRFGPGVEWAALPGAREPARTRPLRLAQLRRQAARFAVSVGSRRWAQTRLLPQPVFRAPESGNDDLAVFVFVQGTDPECVLLLHATDNEGWRFALTRQTKWGLRAELDGRLIWERAPNHRPLATAETPFLVIARDPESGNAHSDQRD